MVYTAYYVQSSPNLWVDTMEELKSKKELPWWKRLLKNLRIVRGWDEDFGEDMKIGIKTKVDL